MITTLHRKKALISWSGRLLPLVLLFSAHLLAGKALAASLYVSDTTVEANLRTGSSTDHRIIALLRPGTRVTLIGEEDGWAKVSLEDGRTGWILSRYLTDRPPWIVTARKLERENQSLREKLKDLEHKEEQLLARNSELQKELASKTKEQESLRREYRDLKKGSANYLELKSAYDNLKAEAVQTQNRLQVLQKAHEKLKLSRAVRWFLSGAGVLILGWLLGLSMGRLRRRRTRDYYKL